MGNSSNRHNSDIIRSMNDEYCALFHISQICESLPNVMNDCHEYNNENIKIVTYM